MRRKKLATIVSNSNIIRCVYNSLLKLNILFPSTVAGSQQVSPENPPSKASFFLRSFICSCFFSRILCLEQIHEALSPSFLVSFKISKTPLNKIKFYFQEWHLFYPTIFSVTLAKQEAIWVDELEVCTGPGLAGPADEA